MKDYEKVVSVTCSACGAGTMTLSVVHQDEDHKTVTLSCVCGESVWQEEMSRKSVKAILCGPGSGGSVVIEKVWGLR